MLRKTTKSSGCKPMGPPIYEKKLHRAAILRYNGSTIGSSMGDFIEIGVNGASMQVVSGVFCAAAIGIYALMQPDASDDDDSNGGGGGGLMQPIS